MLRYLLYIVFGFILFSSCRNSKDLIYLQGIDSIETNFSRSEKINEYKIQNADLLYVNISSQNEAINAMFNKNSSSQFNGQRFNQISLYFNAYLVNDSGYISLPVIGDIKVAGLDIKSIKSLINEKAKVFITDAAVDVRLSGFKITVLGEVSSPGIYYLYQDRVSLFDAIGQAGDLTDYGNRENILIIRPTENGSVSFRIDLSKKDMLNSADYFLEPNDIVYIEPLKSKAVSLMANDYSAVLSIVSATLTAIVLVLTLTRL